MTMLSFRAQVFVKILLSMVSIVVLWFLWKAVFGSVGSGSIKGLTLDQTFTYVVLATAIRSLFVLSADWEIYWLVRSGDIVNHLTRPVSLGPAIFASGVGTLAGNFLLVSIPTVVAASFFFPLQVPGWDQAVLLVPAVVQAFLLAFLIDYIVGLVAFWTESIWGIIEAKEMLIAFLSGGLIPLQLFPDAFQPVLRFLPFGSMYDTVIKIWLGAWGPAEVAGALALQSAWVVVLLGLASLVSARAWRKLVVAGG